MSQTTDMTRIETESRATEAKLARMGATEAEIKAATDLALTLMPNVLGSINVASLVLDLNHKRMACLIVAAWFDAIRDEAAAARIDLDFSAFDRTF